MQLIRSSARRICMGFTLVEVMVALLVMAVGLLGIASMQAVAMSSTGVASQRSLAAIEAASLASAMHANRAYWGATGLPSGVFTLTQAGGTVSISDATLATAVDCSNGAFCSPSSLAAYDVQRWGLALADVLPNATATVTCPVLAQTRSCTIQLQWTEAAVSSNQQEAAQAAAAAAFKTPTYTLFVQP
ncbi:MAG: type IV pilus modification protein PilV [Proteobacteria bacterium]|nr:type IV pilus modification protein PilV [Pseudomonadota bacterium]